MDLLYDAFYCIMIREVNTFYVISNLKISKSYGEHKHGQVKNQKYEWERLPSFYT